MKVDKQKNLVMMLVATAVLAAVNVGVWLASQKGAIAPVGNMALWGAFVVLNVVSIIWAVSLLGLQPLVVSISYVVGGIVAFMGVREAGDINVAEMITAGATYGAFGALAICNATTKVRLAFFKKGQVPFIFIIVALLVLDAIINSGVSSAGATVILNAVLLPFILAGVLLGCLWTILNRVLFAKKSGPETAAASTLGSPSLVKEAKKTPEAAPMRMQAPASASAKPETKVVEPAARDEKSAEPSPTLVEEKEAVEPSAVKVEQEETFFPLEIDRDKETMHPSKEAETTEAMTDRHDVEEKKKDQFARSTVDSTLDVSTEKPEVKLEPKPETKSEKKPEDKKPVVVEQPVAEVAKESVKPPDMEQPAIAASEKEAEKKTEKEGEPKKPGKSDDWLSSHMDLLKKLK